MSASDARLSIAQVRRAAERHVRGHIEGLSWLSGNDKAIMLRLMLAVVPAWHAAIQRERLLKLASGKLDANDIRAAGIMALSNMLIDLARNTTEQGIPDREARIRESVEAMHRLILENLKPESEEAEQ